MLENNEEISETLEKREFISKKSGLVIAMANRVNGSIFAKSLERFSLIYDDTLTDATNAAETKRIVDISIPSARIKIRIDRNANQKKVRIGRTTMYSII